MIKIFEMFAGFGGASFALKKAGIEFETVGYSEIDKYAIQCYEQNHGYEYGSLGACEPPEWFVPKNFGDCTKIDPNDIPDFDLLTGGFPCQSFSVAGKGLGEQDTRGTLFHEIIRIAEVKKPKFMLLENVKGLTFKPHKATFEKILSELDRIGYKVFWKVLNSKDYGIPQNRERIFFVCFRKDLETNFKFPEKEELKIFLKDILEDNVEDKYYLSQERVGKLLKTFNVPKTDCFISSMQKNNTIRTDGLSNCLPSAMGIGGGHTPMVKHTRTNAVLTPDRLKNSQNGRRFKEDGEPMFTLNTQDRHSILQVNNPRHSNDRIYDKDGISPTLNTMQGGDRQPFIIDDTQGFDGVRSYENICPTLRSSRSGIKVTDNMTIRKLTPRECFRLMGFLDDNINLEGLSNTQRYKLAGNGWDINLVSKIFKEMFK